ncbi:MAG: AAA family ATPase, partial [Baekduiaceae bacterium]
MLLGRAHELTEIDTLLADAAAGRGRALLIRGEPGIGKTALLDCALDRADTAR